MKIILIYLTLVTFYIDQVMGAVGFGIKGFSLFNINIYLLLFAWVITVLQRRKVLQPNNVNKYIVLMGFLMLISVLVKILHGEIPISIKDEIINFKSWLNPVLLFFLLFNIIDDKETCNRMLLGLCFLFIALILTQLSATFGISRYKAATVAYFHRAGGFGAPGEYSITLALFFPFVVSGIFFMRRSLLFKIFCINLGFLILMGLINAGSRNGVISFLFGMVVYLFILKRKKIISILPAIFLMLTIIVGVATAYVFSPSYVTKKIDQRFDLSESEDLNEFASGRIALLQNGWKLFVDSPIFGHGTNTFEELSRLRGYPFFGVPHNEYLKNLTEHGLTGLVVFLLIFFKIFQNFSQSLETTNEPGGNQFFMYISYIAGLCGYMVGMFATNTIPSLIIFWIYTAVMYKYAQLDMDKKEHSAAKSEAIKTLYPA